MRTLADFKRAMQPETIWEGFNYCYETPYYLGVRRCIKSGSTQFSFFNPETGCETYSDFPKASDIKFREDGTVEIWGQWRDDYRLKLTYKAVKYV